MYGNSHKHATLLYASQVAEASSALGQIAATARIPGPATDGFRGLLRGPQYLEVSQKLGALFGGLYNRDHSKLGSVCGPPFIETPVDQDKNISN